MKTTNLTYSLLAILLSLIAVSCEGLEETESMDVPNPTKETSKNVLSEKEAIALSGKVLDKVSGTRSDIPEEILYVFDAFDAGPDTYNADTLAYIINYSDNGGFAIISHTKDVYPLLAFSDKGKFSFSNEIATDNFINNIGEYVRNESNRNNRTNWNYSDIQGTVDVEPFCKLKMDQIAPWDKYVIEEYPGCPTGCVAVATANVLSYSLSSLNYHNTKFPLKSMVKAIEQKHGVRNDSLSINTMSNSRIGGSWIDNELYLLDGTAINYEAQLMYFIGKDVGMNYNSKGSGADSKNAYRLCLQLGCEVVSGYDDFNVAKIASYLKDKCIVYLRGANIYGSGGHAWIVDGTFSAIYDSGDGINYHGETMLHCDWGWGGNCNGYYSGEVFSAGSGMFRPANFFAVKRK